MGAGIEGETRITALLKSGCPDFWEQDENNIIEEINNVII
jgi:hypothetical protein